MRTLDVALDNILKAKKSENHCIVFLKITDIDIFLHFLLQNFRSNLSVLFLGDCIWWMPGGKWAAGCGIDNWELDQSSPALSGTFSRCHCSW